MDKLIQMRKTMEMSKTQAEGIESTNRIWHKRKLFKTPTEKTSNASEYSSKIKCKFCAREHRPGKTNCPAYGKKCRQCLKWNHFQVCCHENRRGKELMQDNYQISRAESTKRNGQIKRNQVRPRQVNTVQEITSESSMEDVYVFSTLTAPQKLPKFKVKINGTPVSVMADTGSSVNLLDEVNFNKLKKKPILQEANEKIFPYGSKKQLSIKGKCQCVVETDKLYGWKSSQKLGLVQIVASIEGTTKSKQEPIKEKAQEKVREDTKVEELINIYQEVFQGLGKLKGFQVHLHVDKDVQPVAQPHRRVPFHVRKDLEKQLKQDEERGVIENGWTNTLGFTSRGRTKTKGRRENHDANLNAVLQRIKDRGLTLKKEKCQFKKRNLIFQGYVFSENGIVPDPNKVRAIKECTNPKDVGEVRSLLGMTNFAVDLFHIMPQLRSRYVDLSRKMSHSCGQENKKTQ
ncbi:uncharacterized protein LOC124438929 [Xenia sp. Carnegie-2017]|uniref:uncharacterized protein LOC124438929 n=1 Tax=Xenia sp. Carnegie-2017 TaxID=2897299 RepID=UPI001F04BCA1|nr:uncharacterized protein LOC124438929 [Xenia sp. Carnegie-2017]